MRCDCEKARREARDEALEDVAALLDRTAKESGSDLVAGLAKVIRNFISTTKP